MSQEQLTLEPCPFCGKSHTLKIVLASEHWANEYDGYYPHSESYAVMCDASSPNGPGGCGASGGFKATEADAIAVWNRRAVLSATQPAQAAQGEPIMILGETLSQDQLDELWGRYPEVRSYLNDKAAMKAQAQQVAGGVVALKRRLVQIHDALCNELGDTDPDVPEGMTDEEVRDEMPVFWSAKEIAALIGDAPWCQYTTPPQQPAPVVPDAQREIAAALALFPIFIEAQTFRIHGYDKPLEADDDTQFYSKKKVIALLEKLHGHLTAAATPTPPAQAAQQGEPS